MLFCAMGVLEIVCVRENRMMRMVAGKAVMFLGRYFEVILGRAELKS